MLHPPPAVGEVPEQAEQAGVEARQLREGELERKRHHPLGEAVEHRGQDSRPARGLPLEAAVRSARRAGSEMLQLA
jgi:hypothetical protein